MLVIEVETSHRMLVGADLHSDAARYEFLQKREREDVVRET